MPQGRVGNWRLTVGLPLRAVVQSVEAIHAAARSLGCRLSQPFMTLSFLALPVIPSLKLTDKGLVNVSDDWCNDGHIGVEITAQTIPSAPHVSLT